MRAAVCPEYGPPEVVRIEEHPRPNPAAGEVRVRVCAAAVNFPDVLLIADKYQISVPPPFVPGSEFAGVVDETTEGAGDLRIGDRVTGTGVYGAFAERGGGAGRRAERGYPTASTNAPPPRSGSRTARRITRCARSPG